MVPDGGISLPEAARRLSLPPSTPGNRIKAYKAGKLKEIGKNYRPLTELEMELGRVRKELAETRMERDLLKKAAATSTDNRSRLAGYVLKIMGQQ